MPPQSTLVPASFPWSKPGFVFPTGLHRVEHRGGLLVAQDVRPLLPLHPAQKWGEASEPLLKAIWDYDVDTIEKKLPPVGGLNDDDWVYLFGRDTIHSALWEALCNIIVPRRRFDRGLHGVRPKEHALLKALLRRRPGGAHGLLRGCLRIQNMGDVGLHNGGARRSLTPIAAVLSLCECSCVYGDREEDFFKKRRACACLRALLLAGAHLQPSDAYFIARACRRRYFQHTYPSIRLLMDEGELGRRLPDVCARPHVAQALAHLRAHPPLAANQFDNDEYDRWFEGDARDLDIDEYDDAFI